MVQTKFKPLISIITVVFNGEDCIEKTIKSITNQTYPHIEYIIIDGGSNDRTLEFVNKYDNYIDSWVSEQDNGIFHAMNKGAVLATGSYIYFLNAGDTFYSDKVLDEVFNSLDALNLIEATLVVGNVLLSLDGVDFGLANRKGKNIPHQGAFVKKEVFEKVTFDENISVFGDALFWEKMSQHKVFKPVYIDTIVALFPMDGVGSSPEFIWKRFNESKKIFLNSGSYLPIIRRLLLALTGFTIYKLFGKKTYFNVFVKIINYVQGH